MILEFSVLAIHLHLPYFFFFAKNKQHLSLFFYSPSRVFLDATSEIERIEGEEKI